MPIMQQRSAEGKSKTYLVSNVRRVDTINTVTQEPITFYRLVDPKGDFVQVRELTGGLKEGRLEKPVRVTVDIINGYADIFEVEAIGKAGV